MSSEYSCENINEEGYRIVLKVLDDQQLNILKENIIKRNLIIAPILQKYNIYYKTQDTQDNKCKCLVSNKKENINYFFEESVLDFVTFNSTIYELASQIMENNYLVHSNNPGSSYIKVPGTNNTFPHIEKNLFKEDNSSCQSLVIQSLIMVDIDNSIRPQENGSLCILTYFHHYWNFAKELFDPFHGLAPMKDQKDIHSFFILHSSEKDENDFNSYYLPLLKKYAKIYNLILENDKDDPFAKYMLINGCKTWEDSLNNKEKTFFNNLMKKKVKIPHSNLLYIEKMDWKPISLNPGDMVFFYQQLPRKYFRNRSKKSLICVYYNVFSVEKGWYGSEHQKQIAKQFQTGDFYYTVEDEYFLSKHSNEKKIEMTKENRNFNNIIRKCSSSDFVRKITGQESWWQE